MTQIINSLDHLHPRFRSYADKLLAYLSAASQAGQLERTYKAFETFRTPLRQAELLAKGTTKAGPFKSAHQWGMAIDIVAIVDGDPTWNIPHHDLIVLQAFRDHNPGFAPIIHWDPLHFEWVNFTALRQQAFHYNA